LVGVVGGAVTIIAGLGAAVGFAAAGGPASAAALPNSCPAATSASAAEAAAAAKSDISPAGMRAAATVTPLPGVARGIDISSHNAEPNFSTLKSSGVSFVSVKATEGDYYVNTKTTSPAQPGYTQEVTDATTAGLSVMPYVFANPYQATGDDNGSGTCQADYAWQAIGSQYSASATTGLMLPVVLDIEPDPYASTQANSNECYAKTPAALESWIGAFLGEMKTLSGKTPIIYTDPSFWSTCTGNYPGFSSAYPLWLADYGPASPPGVPGWSSPAFWQYTSTGTASGVTGNVDLDYLTPVTQNTKVNQPVTLVQIRTLSTLANPGTTFQYSASGLPPGLSISAAGVITGTPTTDGSYTVSVTVSPTSSESGTSSTVTFIWDVSGAITFPAQASRTSSLGAPVSAQLNVTDSNFGQSGYTPPTFSATGLPAGLSISPTGLISGWASTAGTYSVKVTATDGLGATSIASFTWTVRGDAGTGTTGAVHQQGGSNKCLDDPSSKTTGGTAIDLSTCTGKSNQSWTFVMDGSVRVLGHCLAASGTHVLLYSCDDSIADQWQVSTDGSLVSVRYGTCLNGPSGSAANGTKPTLAACTNTTSKVNQHWTGPVAPIAAGVGPVCMFKSGSAAEIGTCGNYSVQHWDVASNSEIAVQSSYCLTEGGTTAGAAVTVINCANAASQHWTMVAAGRIAQEIKSVASGLCVTVPSGASANGTHLVLGTCSTALNGTWRVG
jgi:GH25 family lysozyme M1 (1,4-beta-N-acetylmuramidase)